MIAPSELIINPDGSCFHLHLKPEQLADKIIMVGDPDRVNTVASYFDTKECEVSSREFHTITGTYKGKRITTLSHGIGTDNIDIVLNELDALANIDFASRTIKPIFRQLTMVRVGTSGGLQPFVPVGTYVAAGKSIGFRRSSVFLCRLRESARQGFRIRTDETIEMEAKRHPALCRFRRSIPGQADHTRRYYPGSDDCSQRLLRSARPQAPLAARRSGTEP